MSRGQKRQKSYLTEYWFPFIVLKWRRKTLQMSLEEEGCFLRLIMYYYDNRVRLPNDDTQLARIASITPEKFAELSTAVKAMFYVGEDGKLWNNTCEENLLEQCSRSHKNKKRAKTAARARWDKDLKDKGQNALSMPQACYEDNTKMPQDRTGQDKREQDKKEIHPSKPDLSLKPPLPPGHEFGSDLRPPRSLQAGPSTGFKTLAEAGGIGGERGASRFHLGTWLDANPDARTRILRELLDVCPGHDRNWLLAEYDRTSDKRDGVPSNPERAFIGWAKKLYGKK